MCHSDSEPETDIETVETIGIDDLDFHIDQETMDDCLTKRRNKRFREIQAEYRCEHCILIVPPRPPRLQRRNAVSLFKFEEVEVTCIDCGQKKVIEMVY
jgi:Zn finger protein HypA/HybF involved in hydrogenase expression